MIDAGVSNADAAGAVGELVRLATLRGGWNSAVVLLGTVLFGVAAGTIGTFLLLRKRALVGDALSHATLPGIAVAFIVGVVWLGVGRSLGLLLAGAAASGILGVLAVMAIVRWSRLREDAAIGVVLSVFFGAGAVLLSFIQSMPAGNRGGLSRFIYGQTAAMSAQDAALMGGIAVVGVVASLMFLKEFRVVCFDSEFSRAQGWPVGVIDVVMMAFVVVVTVVGLQAVGLILVVAMIIIPAAAARFWTERLGVMVVASALIGGLSGYAGAIASAAAPRMPAGAMIVLAAGALFLVSMLLAPARGMVARAARELALRRMVATQHALRTAYEHLETAGRSLDGSFTPDDLAPLCGAQRAGLLVGLLRRRGYAEPAPDSPGRVRLTEKGRREASRITRNHRLWEEYLVTYADVAPTHVDFSADRVEHILSAELVERLVNSLRRRGRELPAESALGSVHEIGRSRRGGAP